MSTDTERISEETDSSFLERWQEWYHLPILGAVMLFMYWVRTRPQDNFGYADGSPALGGIDSYYHWRTVEWTTENYPYTMPFDVFTGYPTGRYVGQFGTLFDQLIATAAMIVGVGDPSTETVFTVALLSVPVMAALIAVPAFYMGRRLGGTFGGIVSVVILALLPGQFLSRTTVGQLQHHVAEVLFMAIAVLAMMVALRVAERDQPIYELLVDGDWETLRAPAIYSVLAGVALALYIWVWPPGVVLVGIFAIYFTVQLSWDYVRGVSPDHVAFVGAVSMVVTAIITAGLIEEWSTSATSFGYLQPLAAFLVAAGCVFMAWLARQWNGREVPRTYYPITIVGLLAAAFIGMALAVPDLFDTIYDNLARRLIPFGGTATDATIQEAQRPDAFLSTHVFNEFGAAFYTMLLGLVFLLVRPYFGRSLRSEHVLVVVWALFLTSMAATQVRFAYYLALAVAVVNAAFVADIARLVSLDVKGGIESLRSIETYQVIVLGTVVLVVFASIPLAVGGGVWTLTAGDEDNPGPSPHPDSIIWEGSTDWLAENTPEPGNYGGADNASELDYHGVYDVPEDGNYDYPDGTYGVMSWWDYGHLITTHSERIPHSNPFQQNARSSSAYLTADSEERGEDILAAIEADADVDWENVSDEELEQALEETDAESEMRYVMIDGAMAGGKFGAITQWSGPEYDDYSLPADHEEGETITVDDLEDGYVEESLYGQTMLSQLYFDDADGMEHYRLVNEDVAQPSQFVSYAILDDDEVLTIDGEPQVGVNQELTPQLEQSFQQIEAQGYDVATFDQQAEPGVKTFERVEGATITGEVDESVAEMDNATATSQLEVDSVEGSFSYTQEAEIDDDGTFEMTVPYATNDELGVEDGYTNNSVGTDDQYNITVTATDGGIDYMPQAEGQAEVPETAVVEGEVVDDFDLEEVDEEPDEEDDDETDDEDGTEDDESDEEEANSVTPVAVDP